MKKVIFSVLLVMIMATSASAYIRSGNWIYETEEDLFGNETRIALVLENSYKENSRCLGVRWSKTDGLWLVLILPDVGIDEKTAVIRLQIDKGVMYEFIGVKLSKDHTQIRAIPVTGDGRPGIIKLWKHILKEMKSGSKVRVQVKTKSRTFSVSTFSLKGSSGALGVFNDIPTNWYFSKPEPEPEPEPEYGSYDNSGFHPPYKEAL